ncbi:MAG: 1-acyl-sn-glycerol-3-phosphate acyltransferase [Planctomycetes bacterium]|nr:1-acyl-sn-glycerol-3-phosphate acyltransferase [Planctomycetota bacterium]
MAVVTFVLACVWFVGLPFTSRARHSRRKWRRFIFQAWSRSVLRLCGVRLAVVGAPMPGPCFLVANHLGYMDIMVIASCVDATFVSMQEIVRWPFFGLMARQFDTVFIEREKKRDIPAVNTELESALARCEAVVIFAEGRHTRGANVLPFRPSLLEPAARGGHAVSWAVLHYATLESDPPASQAIPWVDEPLWRQVLVMLALERIDARLEFGQEHLTGDDRKVLARELHERVSRHFKPLK